MYKSNQVLPFRSWQSYHLNLFDRLLGLILQQNSMKTAQIWLFFGPTLHGLLSFKSTFCSILYLKYLRLLSSGVFTLTFFFSVPFSLEATLTRFFVDSSFFLPQQNCLSKLFAWKKQKTTTILHYWYIDDSSEKCFSKWLHLFIFIGMIMTWIYLGVSFIAAHCLKDWLIAMTGLLEVTRSHCYWSS